MSYKILVPSTKRRLGPYFLHVLRLDNPVILSMALSEFAANIDQAMNHVTLHMMWLLKIPTSLLLV
jgi:hypothetical protein